MWKAIGKEKMCVSGSLPKANYIENKEPVKFIDATESVITKNLTESQGHLSKSRNYLPFHQQNILSFSIERDLHRIAYLSYRYSKFAVEAPSVYYCDKQILRFYNVNL